MHDRLLKLDGALNFRDLGGYVNAEGRTTRWGRLFRSDTLHGITVDDLAKLGDLGVATVIDLRSSGEISFTGRGLLEKSSIDIIETASPCSQVLTLPETSTIDAGCLDDVYWRYLTQGSSNFARALQELARPDAYPAVVSCFFGKDRTGVLIALVLACLGIKSDIIARDYAMSANRMPYIIERMRSNQVYNETLDRTPAWRLSSSPATMQRFLARLDSHYGGAQLWALGAGLTSSQLDSLKSSMLS